MSLDDATRDRLRSIIDSCPVVLFMKGNRQMPQCGFSAQGGWHGDCLSGLCGCEESNLRDYDQDPVFWETLPARPLSKRLKPPIFPLGLMLAVDWRAERWTSSDPSAPTWAIRMHQASLVELGQGATRSFTVLFDVSRVVDGDTLYVTCGGNTCRARLLQINTPERGQVGYWEAAEALAAMVDDEDVYLAFARPGQPTRGRYGRVLADLYEEEGTNLYTEMIRQGWTPY